MLGRADPRQGNRLPAQRCSCIHAARSTRTGQRLYEPRRRSLSVSERHHYPPGVLCWIDTAQPEPKKALDFYTAVLGWDFIDSGSIPGTRVARITSRRCAARMWRGSGHCSPGSSAAAGVDHLCGGQERRRRRYSRARGRRCDRGRAIRCIALGPDGGAARSRRSRVRRLAGETPKGRPARQLAIGLGNEHAEHR